MARRKNVKRIDPRYFLNETVNRGEVIAEGVKDYIKSPALPSSIPMGSLTSVLTQNPELLQVIKGPDSEQKMQAFAEVGELLAQDRDIAPIAAKEGGIENILDVGGLIQFAELQGLLHRIE
tara:strand:+ start:143 stop:505 length:363 start_codon:yes stop_codon:yes gene_type:complete